MDSCLTLEHSPVDAARLRELVDLDPCFGELRGRLNILCEVLEKSDLKPYKGAWVRRLAIAVDVMYDAVMEGEREVVRQRIAREMKKDEAREARAKKAGSRRPVGPMNENLSHDPETIPGAIRMVLARSPEGLLVRELMAEVAKARPGTSDASVSAALHPMVKRREIARNGHHKNYRYLLIVKRETPSATATGHAESEERPM